MNGQKVPVGAEESFNSGSCDVSGERVCVFVCVCRRWPHMVGVNLLVLAMSVWSCATLATVVSVSGADPSGVREDEQVFIFSAVNFTGEECFFIPKMLLYVYIVLYSVS